MSLSTGEGEVTFAVIPFFRELRRILMYQPDQAVLPCGVVWIDETGDIRRRGRTNICLPRLLRRIAGKPADRIQKD